MHDVLLQNAMVLDPEAGTLLPDHSVLVQAGRIVEVSERPLDAADAEVIDLRGKVLMPGLCDAHVHVTAATPDFAALTRWPASYTAARAGRILHDMLLRGFTTVRDVGGADYGLARAIEEGWFIGPRLLFCGHALSQTGGHGDMRGPGEHHHFEGCFCCPGLGRICDGIAEVRKACRDEIRKGATHIKLMVSGGVSSPTDRIDSTQFSLEEIRAAVEEAEAANLPVAAHAYTARAIDRTLRSGVTSIEHGNLLEASSLELFRETGAFLVPTLATYHAIAREGIELGLPKALHAKVFEVLDAGSRALELAYRAGVKLVYGTDLLGDMHRHQLSEFALRKDIVAPADLIRACTTTAAALFQMSGEIGVIASGARADLLVVDGNPLDDVAVLETPERHLLAVMKDGAFHKNLLG